MDIATRSAPLSIHHLALRVADCEASRDFYSGVLGLEELRRCGRQEVIESVWLALGQGAILMLERRLRGSGPEAGSGHLLALAVDDLAPWESRLAELGIAIEDRTRDTIYVCDPDGHRVGLTVFPRSL
jgi:catechol 2,3-dioxygenase-like lactoylglutathione lyase family enzyme